jgi:hypothetical protein
MFLLDRLISRSCKALAVMIGCGQRIRSYAGSSEDPDADAVRVSRVPASPGLPQLFLPRFRTFRAFARSGRRVAVFRAVRPPSSPKGGLRWTVVTS